MIKLADEDEEMSMKAEVFAFLEELRESGEVNMMGAVPYIMDEFGFSKRDAKTYLMKWMESPIIDE